MRYRWAECAGLLGLMLLLLLAAVPVAGGTAAGTRSSSAASFRSTVGVGHAPQAEPLSFMVSVYLPLVSRAYPAPLPMFGVYMGSINESSIHQAFLSLGCALICWDCLQQGFC